MLNKPSPNATQGEKTFYNRIQYFLENKTDIDGYFEPYIDRLRPDFLLLSPQFGVLIVEIKDYTSAYLKTIRKSGEWEYLREDKIEFITNPFDQVYSYWRAIKDRINHCNFPKGTNIPITRIVVFSLISEKDDVAEEIRKMTPVKIQIFFKENLTQNKKCEEFLLDSLPLNSEINSKDFQTLKGNIIPTSRLPTLKQADLTQFFTVEDLIKLLDKEQERMARKLGDGHRLLFGVAGSGKTVLLIARARILALKHPDWKILILCYNKFLKQQLFQLLNPQDYDADITIETYHSWARQYILRSNTAFSRIYEQASEKAEKEHKFNDLFQVVVPKLLLDTINELLENKVMYDAILIDEAQDFEKDWFHAITLVLNPDTNSLLITCDGIQGIYARKQFTWSSVGIQARGRVKKFEKSYRTPIEIGILAQKTLPDFINNLLNKFDEFIPTTEFIGADGIVEILIYHSREEESRELAEKISRILKQPQEILVLFKYNWAKRNYNHPFFKYLKEIGIEWKSLDKHVPETPGLFIGTIHGTKGLESKTIIIPEVDSFNSERDRQLLYVGMTRSRKKLILTAKKSTNLIDTLISLNKSE